jgi:hypothetical protein
MIMIDSSSFTFVQLLNLVILGTHVSDKRLPNIFEGRD